MRKFFVTATGDISLGELVDRHLTGKGDAEAIITSGGVWRGRNERLMEPDLRLKKGETVRVYVSSFQGRNYLLRPGQVVFEDEDLLVVYKPVDLNVHAVPSSIFYNLSYGVARYLGDKGLGVQPSPPTRLDRPVEGLVLFGKHKQAEKDLFRLIREGQLRKWYLAALEKGENPVSKRIKDVIMSDGAATRLHSEGKVAETLFYKVGEKGAAEIYSVFPFTGRRHQIRFHASHYLSPIVGDRLYGSSLSLKPDEVALMCRGYNFPWKGKKLRIRLPEERVADFLEKLDRAKPQDKNSS